MRISLTLRPDVVNKHDYLIYMPRSESHSYGVLPYVTRDGACGGPLKCDVRESNFIKVGGKYYK